MDAEHERQPQRIFVVPQAAASFLGSVRLRELNGRGGQFDQGAVQGLHFRALVFGEGAEHGRGPVDTARSRPA